MWQRIKRFFKDSETIFWARLQFALGIIGAAITFVAPSILQPIVANGVFTKYLRRRREGQL